MASLPTSMHACMDNGDLVKTRGNGGGADDSDDDEELRIALTDA